MDSDESVDEDVLSLARSNNGAESEDDNSNNSENNDEISPPSGLAQKAQNIVQAKSTSSVPHQMSAFKKPKGSLDKRADNAFFNAESGSESDEKSEPLIKPIKVNPTGVEDNKIIKPIKIINKIDTQNLQEKTIPDKLPILENENSLDAPPPLSLTKFKTENPVAASPPDIKNLAELKSATPEVPIKTPEESPLNASPKISPQESLSPSRMIGEKNFGNIANQSKQII